VRHDGTLRNVLVIPDWLVSVSVRCSAEMERKGSLISRFWAAYSFIITFGVFKNGPLSQCSVCQRNKQAHAESCDCRREAKDGVGHLPRTILGTCKTDSMGKILGVEVAEWIPSGSWKDVLIGNYDYKYLFIVGFRFRPLSPSMRYQLVVPQN